MDSGYGHGTAGRVARANRLAPTIKPVHRQATGGTLEAERFTPTTNGRANGPVIVPEEEKGPKGRESFKFPSFSIGYQTECPECGSLLQEDENERIECQSCPARWRLLGGQYRRRDRGDGQSAEELRRQRWGLD